MDLILWRHAEAEDGTPDHDRRLTRRGHRQALRMARWLDQQLPASYRILSSPTTRARQTAAALSPTMQVDERLEPGMGAKDVLEASGWRKGGRTVVVVGHQPTIGQIAALLMCGREIDWRIKKGAICWLSRGDHDDDTVTLKALVSPDMIP